MSEQLMGARFLKEAHSNAIMGSTFYRNRLQEKAGRGRKTRPKTFSSEDLAKKWAEEHNLEKYILRNLKFPEKKWIDNFDE